MDDPVITCDEIIDAQEKETIQTNFTERKVACKINYYSIIDSC